MQKAHSNIQNILLQLLDEGRLTDGQGRTVDFTNCIIIFTSNLGAVDLIKGMDIKTGTVPPLVRERVLDAVRGHFKPEFLNRLDDIVLFHPLTPAQLSQVVSLIFKQLGERLLGQERNIALQGVTPAAIKFVLYEATKEQPEYGARPIKRWIEKHITTTMASLIVQGRLPSHCAVQVDYDTAAAQLLFNVTSKAGKKETLRVDLKKAPVHADALHTSTHAAMEGGVAGGRKRNVAATDELASHDKKTQRARNLGLPDEDEDEEDEYGEKMEM